MTNAKFYLKPGIDTQMFMRSFLKSGIDDIAVWLTSDFEPILSVQEKVILESLPSKYEYIGRTHKDELYISIRKGQLDYSYFVYQNLFKWIKRGEEYKISELLGEDE